MFVAVRWLVYRKQLANEFQLFGTMAIRQEAELTDPHKAFRQHMHQEPTQELDGRQRHRPWTATSGVVFVTKLDTSLMPVATTVVGLFGEPARIATPPVPAQPGRATSF